MSHHLSPRRLVAGIAAMTVAAATVLGATPAVADTAPVSSDLPETVAADGLPTVQVNGVVWDQEIVGNRVYAVGQFTTARPAGAAAGVSTVPRANMLAYDLTTGALVTSFAPNINGEVMSVSASPDGRRLFVGGSFTSVNGVTRNRVAAFDVATGGLVSNFAPSANASVKVVEATSSTLYIGGIFTSVGSAARSRVAAVSSSTGALLPFLAESDDRVNAMAVSPDGTSIVVGGNFTTMNGSSQPGYGLARLNAQTGASLTFPINDLIRNGGAMASIYNLYGDAAGVYGVGYGFNDPAKWEGTFAADWEGNLRWMEDCHGDSYDVYTDERVTYKAGHPYKCDTVGGYPETAPRQSYYANAYTNFPTGTLGRNTIGGYANFEGRPAPTLLNYYPTFTPGTYTGQTQATWTVTGNGDYVVYGGEFTRVNGVGQQGLVRMAVKEIAPNKQGPRLAGAASNPQLTSVVPGRVRITWPGNSDRDNETLTYRLYRTALETTPIFEQSISTPFWKVTRGQFLDTGLAPGSTQRYRLEVVDPFGNIARSEWVTVTVAAEPVGPYAQTVVDDGAASYWRMGEASGTSALDWAGFDDVTAAAGVTRGAAGAVSGNTAAIFDGTTNGYASTRTAKPGPDTFTAEAWVRTTSTTGGKVIGFGRSATGSSTSHDRHVYLDNTGRVFFGVSSGGVKSVNSTQRINDGAWHHVVATLGSGGMSLYVDGVRVGRRTDATAGQAYSGYWRIGGDSIGTSWPSRPTSHYLKGELDEVAIYPTALGSGQVAAHYSASGRTAAVSAAPADAYGAAVRAAEPDLYWRLGESAGTTAADSGPVGSTGTYRSGVTLGVQGALAGVTDTAARFDGVDDLLSSNQQFTNPTTYSQELWFNTTTTAGGKLIGFGDRQDLTSTTRDRHVYMGVDGRLTFGVFTGSRVTLTTPGRYNDGAWHHLVATQSAAGMRLYVDGVLVGTNAETRAQNYAGYWRVGGDVTWGPQPWFAGRIDEVAVYSTALSAQAVADHFALGTSTAPVNQPPTARFTAAASLLTATVDGSTSSDPDGSVASYAWEFGDGGTGTGVQSSHTYADAGTYTVRLTVTDDDGSKATTTQAVAVTAPAPNAAPAAAIAASSTDLAVQVDGSGSTDSDGTVVGYAWTFGDGGTATGRTASHIYTEAGTYTVGLTVTDDDGATASATRSVTVTAPTPPPSGPAPLAADTFDRAVTTGWGAAVTGGTWTTSGAGQSVSAGAGRHRIGTAGATLASYLPDVSSLATDVQVTATVDKPATGGPQYLSVIGRRVGTADYRARIKVETSGAVSVQATRGEQSLAAVPVSALSGSAGIPLRIRTQVTGASPTTIRVKVWRAGTTEPAAWQVTATDSTAGLQTAGSIGLTSYVSSSTSNIPVVVAYDDLVVGRVE